MSHRADENSGDMVIVLVPSNFATVFKFNQLEARTSDVAGLKTSINCHFHIAIHLEVAVGALGNHVAARWMMASLLHEDLGAILSDALVSLAKNRVQRLRESAIVDEPAKVSAHDQLHSLDWVCGLRCAIHVNGQSRGEARHSLQHRLGRHDSDRKTNTCQVKVATQDFAPDHLQDIKNR